MKDQSNLPRQNSVQTTVYISSCDNLHQSGTQMSLTNLNYVEYSHKSDKIPVRKRFKRCAISLPHIREQFQSDSKQLCFARWWSQTDSFNTVTDVWIINQVKIQQFFFYHFGRWTEWTVRMELKRDRIQIWYRITQFSEPCQLWLKP